MLTNGEIIINYIDSGYVYLITNSSFYHMNKLNKTKAMNYIYQQQYNNTALCK